MSWAVASVMISAIVSLTIMVTAAILHPREENVKVKNTE
jgi:hypothetical protein